MIFSDTVLTILVLVSLALSLMTVGAVVFRGVGNRSRTSAAIPLDRRVGAKLDAQAKEIKRLETAVRQLAVSQRTLEDLLQGSIRKVGVVRFDAFEDMGGRLSFSAALLNGRGDGVVITSINGRQESRSYAKPVARGSSTHNLSDEEQQAIQEALGADRQIAEAR